MKTIIIFTTTLFLIPFAFAGTWHDDFTGESLNGWKKHGTAIWETADSVLHGKQPLGIQRELCRESSFLEWTAVDIPMKNFKITGTGLDFHGGPVFGIALGKDFSINGKMHPFWYVFAPSFISAYHSFGVGFQDRFPNGAWLARHPGTRWGTRKLEEMEISFQNGLFKYSGNGELRAEFDDLHFDQIEQISILIVGVCGFGSGGWIDRFEITGPAIPDGLAVSPQGRVATTWGQIKRHRRF